MRYDGLNVLPGTRMSPSMMTGGNIFRRGFNFLRRNVGRFLRSGARVLPHAIDRFVQLGSDRGHIPTRHRRVYDDYRKYVHMVPGLLDRPIRNLEERLNAGIRPTDKTDARLDDLAERMIGRFEDRAMSGLRQQESDIPMTRSDADRGPTASTQDGGRWRSSLNRCGKSKLKENTQVFIYNTTIIYE